MKVIFLDDDEYRQESAKSQMPFIHQTRTAEETIRAIQESDIVDYLFLDHDLGGEIYVDSSNKNTGAEVARWIQSNKPKIKNIIIHTFNPAGRKNMLSSLEGYVVYASPFGGSMFQSLVESINKGV